jgi:hypothetical protein
MRHLLILAAAAFLAVGCHNRNEDETGAAPERGDAAVTATDTASVQTDSTMGQVPEPTVTDSSAVTTDTTSASAEATVGADSVGAQGEVKTDSTAWTADSTSEAPADTTAKQ